MPNHKVPEQWGICFAGNESAFCDALDAALTTNARAPFIYAEIGIGHGDTIRAVSDYLAQSGIDFEINGVDLPTMQGQPVAPENYQHKDRIKFHLIGADDFFKRWQKAGTTADFIFIDGCHGAPCVKADFLNAEKIIKPGGVVAFHDTDPGCQDIHMQPHCQTGIRAREAVHSLGLLDDTRPGWKKIGETTGNKTLQGHGCLFVQRA